MSYSIEQEEFVYSDEQYKKDKLENLPDNVRMAERCLPAMNAVNKTLKFTTESPEEFHRCRLPTLDFVLWLVS